MTENFKEFYDNVKVESSQNDWEDCISRGSFYFICGFKKLGNQNGMYYNHTIAVAIAAIGRLYTEKDGQSDYKRGIVYIAKKANVNKRHVKVLRKKFKAYVKKESGYVFRTPYDMPKILIAMIELLENKKAEPLLVDFLKEYSNKMYREVLVGKQFLAVEASAGKSEAGNKEKTTYNQLDNITNRI